ncbi:MAG: hypothetical protein HY447_04080, partial [Candidatus Omnitrophica bacterium]|nr:hypothetical protein [Candidatus Omnitrophota bacterium]
MSKTLAILVTISLILTQALPYGLADGIPLELQDENQVPVLSTDENVPSLESDPLTSTHDAFFDDSPLSEPTANEPDDNQAEQPSAKEEIRLGDGHTFIYDPTNNTGVHVDENGKETLYTEVHLVTMSQTTCPVSGDFCFSWSAMIALKDGEVVIGSFTKEEALPDGRNRTSNISIIGVEVVPETGDEPMADRKISDDSKDSLKDGTYELPSGSDLGIIIGGEIDTSNTKIEPSISPTPYPYTKLDPSKTIQPSSGDPSSYPPPPPDPSELETRELPETDLPSADDYGIEWGKLPEPDPNQIPDNNTGVGGGVTTTSTVVPSAEQEPAPEEIIQDLEGIIRENQTTFLNDPDDPRNDFDVNGDGKVDATDQILIRNLFILPPDQFEQAFNKLMTAIRNRLGMKAGDEGYVEGLDVDRNGLVDAEDYNTIRNVLLQARAITQLVITDLTNTFAIDNIADLIKQGLIKIKIDLKTLKATVSVDPSVVSPDPVQNAYLANLLGSGKLPREIQYQLGMGPQIMAPCTVSSDGTTDCPPTVFQLERANFKIGDHFFDLNYLPYSITDDGQMIFKSYGDNRLHSVKIYYEDPLIACVMEGCNRRLVKEIQYEYRTTGVCTASEPPVCYTNEVINAHITYLDGSQGPVTSRDVTLKKIEDGKYHIQTVTDYDKDGKVLVQSKFEYLVSVQDQANPCEGCPILPPAVVVQLVQITRTDADGKLLSTITDIHPADVTQVIGQEPAYEATITLPNGKEVEVIFNTLEQLFQKALRAEALQNQEREAAIQRDIDYLVQQLNLSDEQKSMIEVLSAESMTWNDGCVGWGMPGQTCTQALVDGYQVVLRLYQNEYEFHASQIDPAKYAAIIAMKDLIGKGVELSSIRIDSSNVVSPEPDPNKDTWAELDRILFEVTLSSKDKKWTYLVDYYRGEIVGFPLLNALDPGPRDTVEEIEAYLNDLVSSGQLDIDGDGRSDALSDGVLVVRYLMGLRGNDLVDGALSPDATRSIEEIEALLEGLVSSGTLDINGNGETETYSDGLLVIGYLFGFRGDVLVNIAHTFDVLDQNDDQDLTVEEALSVIAAVGRAVAGLDPYNPDYDANGDGQLTVADWTAFKGIAHLALDPSERGMLVAATIMDQNNDGILTLQEAFPVVLQVIRIWRGLAEYDPAYDLDGDGQISISEATLYSSVAAILVDGFSRAMQA